MTTKFNTKDRVWLWFSLGAVASFVGSSLVRTAITIALTKEHKPKLDDTQSSDKSRKYFLENQLVDDSGEEPCRVNGATLISQLRLTDWSLNTSNTLEELDMAYMNNHQITRMAGELWFVLRKNILSLETAYERWSNENGVVHMLRRILLVYKDALKALEHLATTLEINLVKQGLSGTAQSWPNCICFLANYGTCVEIVAAIALSFPVGQQVWMRLRDELKKSKYHWHTNQLWLFDKLAKPIKNFDEIAIKALNEGLKFKDTSMSRIEKSAKVLQDSVELFWKYIVVREGELDSEAMTGFDLIPLLTPKVEIQSSLLSDIDLSSDLETPRDNSVLSKSRISPGKQFMRHSSFGDLKRPVRRKYQQQNRVVTRGRSNTAPDETNLNRGYASMTHSPLSNVKHPVRKKYQQQNRVVTRNRSNTAPIETNQNWRYERMSSAEQKSELNDMKCVMHSLLGEFNKIQEECSSHDEYSSSYVTSGHNFMKENSDSSEIAEMAAMHRQLSHLQVIEKSYSQQVEMRDSSELSTLESKDSEEQLSATI